jgi:predicted lysophospholipase L1 biosynthesis ABC-type transport system permease subunit
MDIVTLRLLFAAGIVALGVLAALLGVVVARLTERVRFLREEAAASTPRQLETGGAHPGARGFWLERSAARRL